MTCILLGLSFELTTALAFFSVSTGLCSLHSTHFLFCPLFLNFTPLKRHSFHFLTFKLASMCRRWVALLSILFLSFPAFHVLGPHFFCLSLLFKGLCFWLSTQFLNWPPIAGDGWPCCPHLGLTPFGIQTQDRSQKCKDIEDFFCRGLTFFLCFSICNQHAVSHPLLQTISTGLGGARKKC